MGGGLAAHPLTSSADLSRNRHSLAGADWASAICCELFRIKAARRTINVIASAAKQSIVRHNG
jgi:hypothetical protein